MRGFSRLSVSSGSSGSHHYMKMIIYLKWGESAKTECSPLPFLPEILSLSSAWSNYNKFLACYALLSILLFLPIWSSGFCRGIKWTIPPLLWTSSLPPCASFALCFPIPPTCSFTCGFLLLPILFLILKLLLFCCSSLSAQVSTSRFNSDSCLLGQLASIVTATQIFTELLPLSPLAIWVRRDRRRVHWSTLGSDQVFP